MIKIKLYLRLEFKHFNSSKDILAAYLSGASSLKAKFIKSIYYYFGKFISSRRAISVESIPPENNTAILQFLSF